MLSLLGILALLVIGVPMLINLIVVLTVNKLSRPDGLLIPRPDGHNALLYKKDYGDIDDWAAQNGFEPDLAAEFKGALNNVPFNIGVWKNAHKKTFLAAYFTPEKTVRDFVTMLGEDCALTTSATKDSVLMPNPPGVYTQAFDGLDLSTLHVRHEAGLVHLVQTKGLSLVDRAESTDVAIIESIRRQMAYVKGIPLWQLKGAYWFFVRRNALNNKSVMDLYPAG